jgi:hypothetical protein
LKLVLSFNLDCQSGKVVHGSFSEQKQPLETFPPIVKDMQGRNCNNKPKVSCDEDTCGGKGSFAPEDEALSPL